MMETFVLYYRHKVGHKHFLVVQVSQKEIEKRQEHPAHIARRMMDEKLKNIFQPAYLEGLYFVEFKEIT